MPAERNGIPIGPRVSKTLLQLITVLSDSLFL